jgi:hypothetical protein
MSNKWYWASNVAQLTDYSTTLSIARSNGEFVEAAPLTRKWIGENPSQRNVQQYFAGRLLITGLVQCYANPNVSKWLNIIQFGVHSSAAAHNYNIGLRFSF